MRVYELTVRKSGVRLPPTSPQSCVHPANTTPPDPAAPRLPQVRERLGERTRLRPGGRWRRFDHGDFAKARSNAKPQHGDRQNRAHPKTRYPCGVFFAPGLEHGQTRRPCCAPAVVTTRRYPILRPGAATRPEAGICQRTGRNSRHRARRTPVRKLIFPKIRVNPCPSVAGKKTAPCCFRPGCSHPGERQPSHPAGQSPRLRD
jgi:hypothetical protein